VTRHRPGRLPDPDQDDRAPRIAPPTGPSAAWGPIFGRSAFTAPQPISANARFIARAVAATASSAGRVRSVALNGSARTGPS
jgi:hypothetical protein